jgi:hypothetical protein
MINRVRQFCKSSYQPTHLTLKKILRKVKLSPPNEHAHKKGAGAFLFAPLRATLTVEAAMVLPLFLMVMVEVLQYGAVMDTAVKLGTAMTETSKEMAIGAYLKKYGKNTDDIPDIIVTVLSDASAYGLITKQVGDTSSVEMLSTLGSSFLQNDETIDLILTYNINTPFGILNLRRFFLQRARVRAWTGRVPPGSEETDDKDNEEEYVYVTTTGSVYHEDPDCSHLKLSVRAVTASSLEARRNNGGAKYYACEKCGDSHATGIVYITTQGNRYHSDSNCSGLKRTVRQMTKEEAGNLKACSRCGQSS